jgi:DNA-binding NtrC family response regulator
MKAATANVSELLGGPSEVFQEFRRTLTQAAPSAATLLILGESGSGKTLAARAVHASSPRASGPLVLVHVASLAPTLVEAELFGHEEGAFTGATRARAGRFRQAHGGTIVLDEIGSMPLGAQVKLLRVLQDRIVEPVGSEIGTPVDVRVIATARRDLLAAKDSGAFRSDLYFRLAVVTLEVPPLRSRPEDIPSLAQGLMERLGVRHGLRPRKLSPEACDRLASHAWPGNVRELENALERVLVLAASEGPVESCELDFLDASVDGVADSLARQALANGLKLADLEHAMLRVASSVHHGNLSAAARQVGLTRRAFEYRLEQTDPEPVKKPRPLRP